MNFFYTSEIEVMEKYGLAHRAGNYQIVLMEMEEGYSAHIFDAVSNCLTVLHAKTADATYDACLKWASTNIRGEFYITSQNVPYFNNSITATA